MKKISTFAAVALALFSCTDEGPLTNSGQPAAGETYPSWATSSLIQGCKQGFQEDPVPGIRVTQANQYCECTASRIEQNVKLEDFISHINSHSSSLLDREPYSSIVASCAIQALS